MNTTLGTYERYCLGTCSDPEEWNTFIERNDGPPFALWGWGEAVESYGHEWWPLVVRERGSIVGALPVYHLQSYLFGSKLVSPPYGERGSIVLANDSHEAARDLLLKRAKNLADDLAVEFISLRGKDLGDPDGFERNQRFVTYTIDVTDGPESVWTGIKESRRRQIRQARDNPKLTYTVGDSREDLLRYYDLYLRSMRGHGSPPHSFEFFETLWDHFHSAGQIRLGLIERDSDVINGIMELALGTTVYQWGVITDYEFRDLNGGSYLLWKSLEWAATNGYDSYELGRTREGSGVYMFKKSFGGSKHWYDDYHYFPDGKTELPHPEKDTYEPAKRVWRRLPISVTRAIGPSLRKGISL